MIRRIKGWWLDRHHPTMKLRAELARDIEHKTLVLARCRADSTRHSLHAQHYEHEAQVIDVQIDRMRHELELINDVS